jgi:hypothetical protein
MQSGRLQSRHSSLPAAQGRWEADRVRLIGNRLADARFAGLPGKGVAQRNNRVAGAKWSSFPKRGNRCRRVLALWSIGELLDAALGVRRQTQSRRRSRVRALCAGKDDASPDLMVSNCTAMIQSGRWTEQTLSVVFNNRGLAWQRQNNLNGSARE